MKKYLADPEAKRKHRERVRRNNNRYSQVAKDIIAAFRHSGCKICGECEPSCLDAHHLKSDEKEFTIGTAVSNRVSPKRVKDELAKCVCLCANCHRKLHAGVIELSE